MEKVFILVQPDDEQSFRDLFTKPISPQNYQRLDATSKEYYKKVLDMGQNVEFIVQTKQEGFGHAIAHCKDAIGAEPFLLVLGHYIYSTHAEKSCVDQVIEAYNIGGKSVMGLKVSKGNEVSKLGAACGVWLTEESVHPKRLSITEVVEKPT